MKRMMAAAALVVALVPGRAHADDRAGSAALGAVSGAIVFGPVGAVAGALVGYTAGPAIARSWGLARTSPSPVQRRTSRRTRAVQAASASGSGREIPLPPPRPGRRESPAAAPAPQPDAAMPPAQGFE